MRSLAPAATLLMLVRLCRDKGSDASRYSDQILEQLHPSPVYVDLNRNWGEGRQLLSERGFEKQRDLIRMRRGFAIPTSPLVFAIAGPEVG